MMEKKKHREKESIGSFLFLFRRSLLPPPFLTLDLDPPFSNKKTQAKSGMGKTAVFVLSVLQQLDPVDGEVGAIVICHTRELAYQICHEFERFSVYLPGERRTFFFRFRVFLLLRSSSSSKTAPKLTFFPSLFLSLSLSLSSSSKPPGVRVANFFGGLPIKQHKDVLKGPSPPHIVVGTPGRVKQLAKEGDLKLGSLRHFVIDECDKVLDNVEMRSDVQEVFKLTPHDKQVMMFSATLDKEVRPICKKFMTDVSGGESSKGGKASFFTRGSDGVFADPGWRIGSDQFLQFASPKSEAGRPGRPGGERRRLRRRREGHPAAAAAAAAV